MKHYIVQFTATVHAYKKKNEYKYDKTKIIVRATCRYTSSIDSIQGIFNHTNHYMVDIFYGDQL